MNSNFRLEKIEITAFGKLKNVNVIESGEVLTEVESFFEAGSSFVRVSYKLYRDLPYTDIRVDVLWNEQQKALKLKLPAAFDGEFFGQIPFGTDIFSKDGREITAHRFVGFAGGENALTLYNNCTYGFSAEGNDLFVTLLRGAAYCAHPIEDQNGIRELIDKNRYIPYIEQGRHEFSFRLSYDRCEELENNAQEFCNPPYSLNFFSHGTGKPARETLRLSDRRISVVSFYRTENGYTLRLINNNPAPVSATLCLCGKDYALSFGKFEVKSFTYDGNALTEQPLWI